MRRDEAGARCLSVAQVESDYRLPPFLTAQIGIESDYRLPPLLDCRFLIADCRLVCTQGLSWPPRLSMGLAFRSVMRASGRRAIPKLELHEQWVTRLCCCTIKQQLWGRTLCCQCARIGSAGSAFLFGP